MKLIFLVLTFFYFFNPYKADAAWFYVPDANITQPKAEIRYFDALGNKIKIPLSTYIPSGGFFVDPLNPAFPVPLNTPNAAIPPIPQVLIDAAIAQSPIQPLPKIDWLQSSILTAFFIFLWSMAYSSGLVISVFRKGA